MNKRQAKREAYLTAALELESHIDVGACVQLATNPEDDAEIDRIEQAFREVAASLRRRVS